MLCTHALEAYEKNGIINSTPARQRGILINYQSLPGIIPKVVLPMFGIIPNTKWLMKMSEESTNYSKGKTTSNKFVGDSEDKQEHATELIINYSNLILKPTFDKLLDYTKTNLYDLQVITDKSMNISLLKTIPLKNTDNKIAISLIKNKFSTNNQPMISLVDKIVDTQSLTTEFRDQHSSNHVINPYKTWSPFSNTHNSVPFEVIIT